MYLVGVDIGGTFTDCVVIDEQGTVTTAKSPSVPGDFASGLISAIELAASRLGQSSVELFQKIALLSHGTTIGTNAIVQKRGAKVGLITTRGHQDVIHIMRGSRGIGHRDVRGIVHFPESQKPDPMESGNVQGAVVDAAAPDTLTPAVHLAGRIDRARA